MSDSVRKDLLVTLADERYLAQAKQLFSSVYWNAGWQGDYMLLAQDIPDEELKWFEDKGILVTRCGPLSDNNTVGLGYPSTVLSKFQLFTPAFRSWNQVVYLDGDIIVRGSLDYLQTVPGFGARYYPGPLIGQFWRLENDKTLFDNLRKNFDLKGRCFNAGVISFHTDLITDGLYQQLLEYSSLYLDHCKFADEGILSLCFSGRCTALPHSFNRLVRRGFPLGPGHGTVLHFNDEAFRPWQEANPFYEEWSDNLRGAEAMDLSQIQAPVHRSAPEHIAPLKEPFKERVNRNARYFSQALRIRHPSVHAQLKNTKSFLKRSNALRLIYFKLYVRRILFSDKIVCGPESDLDLHMVVCKEDVLRCMWAVKTFRHFSGMDFNLVIHEDGSFTDREINLLEKHFENCEVIRRDEADSRMNHVLEEYPFISKYRANPGFYCALKLIDALFYGSSDTIITLDSDVLFFRKPEEMIGLLDRETPFFTSDYMNSYRYPVEILEKTFGMNIYPKFNAGFLSFSRSAYLEEMRFMESYFTEVDKLEEPFYGINRHEQTLHALLHTRLGAERLGPEYSLSDQPITDKTAFHHFVSDFSKETYYTKGLKLLRSRGFLRNFGEHD